MNDHRHQAATPDEIAAWTALCEGATDRNLEIMADKERRFGREKLAVIAEELLAARKTPDVDVVGIITGKVPMPEKLVQNLPERPRLETERSEHDDTR